MFPNQIILPKQDRNLMTVRMFVLVMLSSNLQTFPELEKEFNNTRLNFAACYFLVGRMFLR